MITLNITTSTSTPIYNISITNIRNPSEVGVSAPFVISTLNSQGSKIISGNSTVTITNPNSLVARFDRSKFYYRMNL